MADGIMKEAQSKGGGQGDIRYLTPLSIETGSKQKYCRFKKAGIRFIDYKDPDFLLKLVNEQGKILPRRLTGLTAKQQRDLTNAVKRARIVALLPFVNPEG